MIVLGIPRCNETPKVFGATLAAVRASTLQPYVKLIVDNGDAPLPPVDGFGVMRPGRNTGCAGAWNAILLRAFNELHAKTAIVINGDCAVAIGTFERLMSSPPPLVLAMGFSCFRIDAEVWQHVGPFDELYYPVYWEDADYRRRLSLAGWHVDEWPADVVGRETPYRAMYSTGITHGWRDPEAECRYQNWPVAKHEWFEARWRANRDRYVAKWGGLPGEETHTVPFGTGLDP
jgi:hypothetical protein